MINVVIWNEFVHEQEDEHVKSIYPNGIHGCIKDFLSEDKELNIKTLDRKWLSIVALKG